MAIQDDGYDFFSDSDLDNLPRNALDELENNAILHTQHHTQATQIINVLPSSDYGDGLDEDDLDDAIVFDEAQGMPERLQALQSANAGPITQREQFRRGSYRGPGSVSPLVDRTLKQNKNLGNWPSLQESPEVRHQDDAPEIRQEGVPQEGKVDPMVEALQKQVQELLREREGLKQDLQVKAGEILIVRSKQEKATKEYERELTVIKKLNTEKLAKQQEAIKAAIEAEKNAATELEFVKRDLLEEAEKVRSLKRSKGKEKDSTSEATATPKKNITLPYRDGFDDDEIQIISPSKFHVRKSNPSTPTKAGIKRKRKGQDSPVVSLEMEQHPMPQEDPSQAPTMILDDALLERIRNPDDRLNFLEMLFDHRPYKDRLRTFEEFTKLAFPSAPSVSIASIVLEKLPTFNAKQAPSDFPIEFCELIVSLWNKCLEEKYYKPLSLLIDLLDFCLELKTLAVAPFIIDKLVPVAQVTAELIAIPRFNRTSYAEYENDIDVSACMAILHLAAQGCINSLAHTSRFWRAMRLDFVLMILSQHQLVDDFDMMLQLLTMSVMKESIGPIAPEADAELQLPRAGYIIDRVSLMLINSPTVPEGVSKHDASIVTGLRLQILRTLEAFCQTTWGGAAVAVHPNAIGRLVKILINELDALYDYRSGYRESSARLICLATRLLHHLTTKHEKLVDMQEILSRIHGGSQKYLVCLARLNFMEDDLVLDANIGPEIQECAHEMLELAVTPEEGDAIHSAFSGT